jgi:hypothetical protein
MYLIILKMKLLIKYALEDLKYWYYKQIYFPLWCNFWFINLSKGEKRMVDEVLTSICLRHKSIKPKVE